MDERKRCSECDWPQEADGSPVGCGNESACELGECCCHEDHA